MKHGTNNGADPDGRPRVRRLPPIGRIDVSDLNPAIYEAMRATLAKVFAGEEPEVPGPGKLEVPVMDAIQGTRWLAHELVETIESSDLPPKHKAHLIGFTISKLVAREAELLKLL